MRVFPTGVDAEPRLFRGVVRSTSVDGARFWYDVAPKDHAAHALLSSTGAAIFKTDVENTTGIRSDEDVVSLVGLRVRPRPEPPSFKDPVMESDESSLESGAPVDRWAVPPRTWGRWTHEAASVSGFLASLDAENRRRERERARHKATRTSMEDSKTDSGLRLVKRKLRVELKEYLLHHHHPPPNLDSMDSAPKFVAEMATLKGINAVVRLAIDYSGQKHEDPEGAEAAFLQIARLASVAGSEGESRPRLRAAIASHS